MESGSGASPAPKAVPQDVVADLLRSNFDPPLSENEVQLVLRTWEKQQHREPQRHAVVITRKPIIVGGGQGMYAASPCFHEVCCPSSHPPPHPSLPILHPPAPPPQ